MRFDLLLKSCLNLTNSIPIGMQDKLYEDNFPPIFTLETLKDRRVLAVFKTCPDALLGSQNIQKTFSRNLSRRTARDRKILKLKQLLSLITIYLYFARKELRIEQ